MDNLEPAAVFRCFEEISAIPRGSGNEAGIAGYLINFAKDKGLWAHKDTYNNVLIRKPGSPGRENEPPVIIQGHSDMVCEKNAGIEHDFDKDPIGLVADGDVIRARGTTLGADNGVGLAYALALLTDDSLSHPPLEALFTAQEEAGLVGASNFDYGLVRAKRLINLDSEEEGVFLAGCSGGARADVRIPVIRQDKPNDYVVSEIFIKGLNGGHSGMDIDKGRANANLLMARVLNEVLKEPSLHGVLLCDIAGGSQDNAIPRECRACIAFDKRGEARIAGIIKKYEQIFRSEYRISDPLIEININEHSAGLSAFSPETAEKLVRALLTLPCGVQAMSQDIPGLVETSNNIGVVKLISEGGKEYAEISSAPRSSVESRKAFVLSRIRAAAEGAGADMTEHGEYPGWEYSPQSPLREACLACYKELTGADGAVAAVHAGVECGVFARHIEGLDAVSFGPNVHGAHSPDECLEIASARRVWEFLLKLLERI